MPLRQQRQGGHHRQGVIEPHQPARLPPAGNGGAGMSSLSRTLISKPRALRNRRAAKPPPNRRRRQRIRDCPPELNWHGVRRRAGSGSWPLPRRAATPLPRPAICQLLGVLQAQARLLIPRTAVVDVHQAPGQMPTLSHAAGMAHQAFGLGIAIHTDQQAPTHCRRGLAELAVTLGGRRRGRRRFAWPVRAGP